jgi:hypothetical protein
MSVQLSISIARERVADVSKRRVRRANLIERVRFDVIISTDKMPQHSLILISEYQQIDLKR